MKDIVIPEGMFKAANEAFSRCKTDGAHLSAALEVALLWLDAELEKIKNNDPTSDYDSAIEAVRRLFIEPEGEFCPTCGLRQDTRAGAHKEEIVP